MSDLISRKAAIDAVYKCDDIFVGDMPVMVVKADAYEALAQLPSAQPDSKELSFTQKKLDTISRQDAIDAVDESLTRVFVEHRDIAEKMINKIPPAQPKKRTEERTETHACDLIDRQAAIEVIDAVFPVDPMKSEYAQGIACGAALAKTYVEQLPSAQPEQHTCVNCGRTVNNGGWYADGGTRCPIEEHYALPKDGYCHLWEKRNVTDDNYPERREE